MVIKQDSTIDKLTQIKHYMLPPQFRIRSSIPQRMKLIIVFLLYSCAMSFIIYSVLKNIKKNFNIVTQIQIYYFLSSVILTILLMFILCFFIYWSRSKLYYITWIDFILYSIFPLTIIFGIWFLNSMKNSSLLNFLWLTGIVSISSGSAVVCLTLIKNILISKKYWEAKYRTFYTMIGTFIFVFLPFIFYLFVLDNNSNQFSFKSISGFLACFIGAILLKVLGIFFSDKYMMTFKKNIWYTFRYTSGLSGVFLYSSLFTFAIKNLKYYNFISPLIIQLSLCVFFLIFWIIYLFLRARVKNINSTNPLFNEIYLKLFIIFILSITLFMVFILPSISKQKSYSEFSFIMLLICSTNILIGVFMAHFFNLITFSKYAIFSFLGSFVSSFLIFAITLSISSLENSLIISQILGREIVVSFIVICLIFQLLTLGINITYVFINIIQKRKDILIDKELNIKKIKNSKNIKKEKFILKGNK